MEAERTEVLVVGAGFSGLIMGLRLKETGRSFVLLEKDGEVGGTWRDNTYPGCACDVPAHLYSIASEPKPDWTRSYAGQPEIQAYLVGVARRRGLYPHIRFGCAVDAADWDEAEKLWRVTTQDGRRFVAQVLVLAVGALHLPSIPQLKGLERFEGRAFHSAQWDHGFDLTGKRVAVIGTGASAIQFVPEVAPSAAKLDLYQRTAPWVLPRIEGGIGPWRRRLYAMAPWLRELYRRWLFVTRELRHRIMSGRGRMARTVERMALRHLERQVPDPVLREMLTPSYKIGCKRILLSNDYFPALARENVEVVTAGIAEVRARSIVTTDGVERPADAIIFGTGFRATDSYDQVDIRGREGATLRSRWRDGMSAALGTTVAGLPNFFMLLGPNTGLGHNSVVLMIEAQADYVMRRLDDMGRLGLAEVEVKSEVQDAFAVEMRQRLSETVWQAGGCRSWYQDAEGRNTTLWPGTVAEFQRRMAAAGLEDFRTA